MRWDEVATAVIAESEADAMLVSVFGAGFRVRNTDESEAEVPVQPGMFWTLVSDPEEEVFEPVHLQLTFWTRKTSSRSAVTENIRAQRAFRRRFRHGTRREIGGLPMSIEYVGTVPVPRHPDPDVAAYAVDYRFTPLRAKYDHYAQEN